MLLLVRLLVCWCVFGVRAGGRVALGLVLFEWKRSGMAVRLDVYIYMYMVYNLLKEFYVERGEREKTMAI